MTTTYLGCPVFEELSAQHPSAGNVENERCDGLAVAAARLPDLPIEEGYEVQPVSEQSALF